MSILDKIKASKLEEIATLKQSGLRDTWADTELFHRQRRKFLLHLRFAQHQPALIAEIKRASPSQGVIREDFDPASLARTYAEAGADCVSVLTDREFFQGSPDDLRLAIANFPRAILRKDFILDPIQIEESKAMGADAILLIARMLAPAQFQELLQYAKSLDLDVLVETHNEMEIAIAIEVGAELIGINSRDLSTFETNLDGTVALLKQFGDAAFWVAESALDSRESVQCVTDAGAKAVLIGTAFCRQHDVGAAVKEIMPWASG